jgi:hypothetical protein
MPRSIHELAPAWEAAEARLYPVVLTRPEAYARYLELIRAIADELAGCGTVHALLEAADHQGAIAEVAVRRSGIATEGLDVELAAQAAFALHYRHVVAATARDEALARISSARDRGDPWVTVAESGDPVPGPYLRLDLHLVDGSAILASVTIDAETGDPRFGLEAYRADPDTGDRLEDADPIAPQETYEERSEWERAAAELRAALDHGSS